MLNERERAEIFRLWERKLQQDEQKLPQSERHRNLEPESAEFLNALACGIKAKALLEIGGSSGLSTIALASAARDNHGTLTSIEIEPRRQAEARETIRSLGLERHVDFKLGDAKALLPGVGARDLVLIDCEKDDYDLFFDMLELNAGAVVVADNILSHNLGEYVQHVRRQGYESITLAVGKGLEVTRVAAGRSKGKL